MISNLTKSKLIWSRPSLDSVISALVYQKAEFMVMAPVSMTVYPIRHSYITQTTEGTRFFL